MNTPSQDRRVKKTKKALRESLVTLMSQKNIRNISVQELSDLADLNRATFYLHYKDIFELLQEMEDEVVIEINAILDQHMPAEVPPDPYSLFVTLLNYIQKNSHLFEMFLGENSNRSFLDKLCEIVENRCLHTWLNHYRFSKAEEELSYFSSYIVYGYVAVITKWLKGGMQSSPEQLAEVMGSMGLYGVGFLEKI